ncbi:MAG TPA: UDP-N-acetylmuramate dehydrogenase, partial [Solirubrobacteraceae bacterium]|nr:UDP-N-acetylmuramate dehydrogenase [Solirubrobacteraceae bacterium]
RPVHERSDIRFSDLTTLRLGGPAGRFIDARSEEEAIAALESATGPLLVMSGGSNLVVSDEGFAGTVVRIANRGVETDGERVTVAAGEPWDGFVALCIEQGFAGVESLSGIRGSAGATPIQNVGAYGQDVSQTIASVRVYDRSLGSVTELAPADCGFGYRTSALKGSDRYLVLSVTFGLARSGRPGPVRYAELARTVSEEPSLAEIREAVLSLRRRKGMVIDPDDPDSISAGSFFVNPILSAEDFGALAEHERPPSWPEPDGRVKTSAAWLIEHAGFGRGFGNGNVGISSKHTLALINRGGATTAELLALARELRDGVRERFGVELQVEPTLVGVEL